MRDVRIDTPRFVLETRGESFAFESYAHWLNDEEVNRFLETRFSEATESQLKNYVEAMQASPDNFLFSIVVKEDDRHIGNIKVGPVNRRHHTAAVGFFIGDKVWWGRGAAREVISAVSQWAFYEEKLLKLTAGSYASNIGSIKALEASGFLQEGRQLDQVQRHDGFRDDVVLFGLFSPIQSGEIL
jgi:ribosomal-protein-alanine N-acetyltransferase